MKQFIFRHARSSDRQSIAGSQSCFVLPVNLLQQALHHTCIGRVSAGQMKQAIQQELFVGLAESCQYFVIIEIPDPEHV